MKRYVREVARDVLTLVQSDNFTDQAEKNLKIERIQRAIKYCERGLLTDIETIQCILTEK